jgi:hypothetical protein
MPDIRPTSSPDNPINYGIKSQGDLKGQISNLMGRIDKMPTASLT